MNRTILFAWLASAAFASPAEVEWRFPRLGNCHEGMPFSDGVTGVLVWGGEGVINLTVGRADLWDHRGGYPWLPEQSYTNIVAAVESGDTARLTGLFKKDTPKGEPRNPYMLPLGRVVVKLDPMWRITDGTLDTETGIGKLRLLRMESSLGKDPDATIEIAMANWGGGMFAMKIPESVRYAVEAVPAMMRPKVRKALEPVGFGDAVLKTNGLFGCVGGGFKWDVPGDRPAVVDWWRGKDNELLVRTDRKESFAWGGPTPSYDIVAQASTAYWRKFWSEGARVKVPDPVLQREFDYGMYRFGAMTAPTGGPAGLQGPWLEDDRLVPWNGDYHFNINVQECYEPAYRGGHFEHLKPLFDMILSWRPRLRENARMFVGIDDGYALPHSVDDRGVCIGGFWTGTIDHGSTAWVADMMYRYVKYSGDTEFLRRDAYDFMKGAMNVYRAMMEDRDGRLSLPVGPSPEWGGSHPKGSVGRDPSFQLAAAHRLARNLIDAAKRLGEQPDPMWLDVENRLPVCNAGEEGLRLFGTQELTESHRHHSHMAGLYPFDILDLADPETRQTVDRSFAAWLRCGTSQWTGWCVPWAAILNVHVGRPVAAVAMLRAWDAFFCDEGHGSHHNAVHPGFTNWLKGRGIMQMDGQCAAAAAVMELMVHEVNGRTEYFRGCPASWRDVSFENIRLSDGRRVSGRRIDGTVLIRESPADASWRSGTITRGIRSTRTWGAGAGCRSRSGTLPTKARPGSAGR